jgi:NagD protein
MDGVFIRDDALIPGADQFLARLRASALPFLILTNNSFFTPGQLRQRLCSVGLDVAEDELWTSPLATADFVSSQRPRGSAFVIGEESLRRALQDVDYTITDRDPDYVVLGETWTNSFDDIATAARLVSGGARFVATNPEPTGPTTDGSLPGCGAVAALIERASGVAPYVVGKPNSLMLREGLTRLGAHSSSTVMIGDRMDTDIQAGVEVGLETILVLSGASSSDDVESYPFHPSRVVGSVAELVAEL